MRDDKRYPWERDPDEEMDREEREWMADTYGDNEAEDDDE